MKNLSALDWIALILVIIGGLNWGLVGIFQADIVNSIFGSVPVLAAIIYIIIGLAAVYLAIISVSLARK